MESGESSSKNTIASTKRTSWTSVEDMKLKDVVQKTGTKKWDLIAASSGLDRCGKSCRFRWINFLRPDIDRREFSLEEQENIIRLHADVGNKWTKIAALLPKRTANDIKNFWNTKKRRRLMEKMGMNPEPLLVDEQPLPTTEPLLVDEQHLATGAEPLSVDDGQQPNDFNVVGNEITTEVVPVRAEEILINPRANGKGLWTVGNINSSSSAGPEYSFTVDSNSSIVANNLYHQTMDGTNHPIRYPQLPMSYNNQYPIPYPQLPVSYSNHPIHCPSTLLLSLDQSTYVNNNEQLLTPWQGLSSTQVKDERPGSNTYANTGQLSMISQAGLSTTQVKVECPRNAPKLELPAPSNIEISRDSSYNAGSSAQGTNALDSDLFLSDYHDCSFDDPLNLPIEEYDWSDLPDDPFCDLPRPNPTKCW